MIVQTPMLDTVAEIQRLKDDNAKLRSALIALKCHLYAQDAMTEGEIIAACREVARKAFANGN